MRALCAAMSAPGHAYPMLSVARTLAARGHEVLFMSGPEHAGAAALAGCSHTDFGGPEGSPREALRPYDDAGAMARGMLERVRAFAPDVVVHDILTLGPALVAEMLGVARATVVVHPLPLPRADGAPFGLGRRLIPLLDRGMVRNAHADRVRAREDHNAVRRSLGLPPTDRLDGTLSPHLVLVGTLPSLELAELPPQARVVGPLLDPDDGGVVPPVPDGDGPLVLLAPSTAHDQAALTDAAVRAVVRSGARAVLTHGPTPAPPVLSPSIVAVPSASHDALLARCAVVVTSGGHGIVARALSHGVPLVIVPGHGDQRENAWRVARLGAAIRVAKPDAGRLLHAIRRVQRAPFKAAAARLAAEAAGLDGPMTAAGLVEQLAGTTGTSIDVAQGETL